MSCERIISKIDLKFENLIKGINLEGFKIFRKTLAIFKLLLQKNKKSNCISTLKKDRIIRNLQIL